MTQTQQTVCELVRAALFGGEFTPVQPVDWQEVCREMIQQTVAALPGDLLAHPAIPRDVRMQWTRLVMQQVYGGTHVLEEQSALVRMLEEAEIPFVVLKGAAAARYYPRPDYRKMGDIDILPACGYFDAAQKLMEQQGYVLREGAEEETRDLPYVRNGVLVELHRSFVISRDQAAGSALEDRIMQAIAARETCTMLDCSFPMLPVRENGLVLLQHISQHLEAGLGLRQIIDWVMYVDRCLHDDQWKVFQQDAKAVGMEELAIVAARTGQLYFGLSQKDITWCSGADEALCSDLLGYVFHSGNFGQKNRKSSAVINAISRSSDGFFRSLQASGCQNWKALKAHPWLKPFAWMYQICRYIRLGFSREHAVRELLADYRESRKLRRLLKRLGATRHGMK